MYTRVAEAAEATTLHAGLSAILVAEILRSHNTVKYG